MKLRNILLAIVAFAAFGLTSIASAESVVIDGTNVRLRYAPNLKSKWLVWDNGTLRSVPKGTHLKLLDGSTHDFYEVEYLGRKFYVSNEFSYLASAIKHKTQLEVLGLKFGQGEVAGACSYYLNKDGSGVILDGAVGAGVPTRWSINGTAVKANDEDFTYQGYKIKIENGECKYEEEGVPVCNGNATLIVKKGGTVKTVPLYMECGD